MLNVTNSPKTATFQMRINPEIKKEVESIYANCGMTLTDAINAFLQQRTTDSVNMQNTINTLIEMMSGVDV